MEGHIQALIALGDLVSVAVDHPTLAAISVSSSADLVPVET